jgi:hypothetical protein
MMKLSKPLDEWGWRNVDSRYLPITTDLDPTPPELLNIIKCCCKMEKNRSCTSVHCNCVKHGLPCLAACKHCNGEACENTQRVIVDDNVDATDATEDLTNLSLFTDDAFNYMDEELVDFNYEATDVSEQ